MCETWMMQIPCLHSVYNETQCKGDVLLQHEETIWHFMKYDVGSVLTPSVPMRDTKPKSSILRVYTYITTNRKTTKTYR